MRERAPRISAARRTTDDEFTREPPLDEIDLQPGERRGYWKHYAPHKWYEQAKIPGKLNNLCCVIARHRCRGVHPGHHLCS
ncbi:hypothetical protein PF003_g33636 [Phytophthora fragariae]|nr:hypothetical protein PF003_g33636 [Phytophthora fragariae]